MLPAQAVNFFGIYPVIIVPSEVMGKLLIASSIGKFFAPPIVYQG
jgi:hypothetical protein